MTTSEQYPGGNPQNSGFDDSGMQHSAARPVPHISIHAFCDDQNSAAAIYTVAQDRRMARAHVAVEMGGIASAYSWFSANPTPSLIILETMLDPPSIVAQLDQLATVCDENTKVIIIGHYNDVLLYRQLVNRGVSEYIVAPVQPIQILESISNLYTDPEAGPIGEVISFIGAKGGAGSSTICHNVGWAMARHLKESVVIADFDVPFGTTGLDFNRDPVQGIADALNAPDRLDDVMLERILEKADEHLNLFTAPAMLDRIYQISPEACDTIITVLRKNMPYVLLDLPHMWTDWSRFLVTQSDQIVMTAEPDLANLRNAKSLFEVINADRDNDKPPALVLNKTGIVKRPEISLSDFAGALNVDPEIVLEFDAATFGLASNNGQMIAEIAPKGKAAESIREMAFILSNTNKEAPRKKSVLGPLLDRFNLKKAG